MRKWNIFFYLIGFNTNKLLSEPYVTQGPITPADIDKFEEIITYNRTKGLNDRFIRGLYAVSKLLGHSSS